MLPGDASGRVGPVIGIPARRRTTGQARRPVRGHGTRTDSGSARAGNGVWSAVTLR